MAKFARYLQIVPAAALLLSCAAADTHLGQSQPLSGDFRSMHDPVMIAERGAYYVFGTGLGGRLPLTLRRSDDLIFWEELPTPFQMPSWTTEQVPGAKGFWAPDIAKVDGRYRLYYSVSTFGSKHSAIGLATSASLDPASPDYGWRDEGLVVASGDADNHNAIDPNFVIDRDGRHWLSFGSFWGGLKLVELDRATGKPLPGAPLIPIAERDGEHNYAVEAPFIFEREGWYYLIVSFDHCCRGAKSTYRLAIGRSQHIEGPYLDSWGISMLDGGGDILIEAAESDRFRGPGHAGQFRDADGRDLLVFHAYDSATEGRPTLRITELSWSANGWPTASIVRDED